MKEKKSFFKSTSFKCIIVLLVIVLISGIFLTICNSIFYVSDDERLARAISKLYDGEDVEFEAVDGDIVASLEAEDAEVNEAYIITTYPGDCLFNITGKNGYSGGTVTCYIVINAALDGNGDVELTFRNITVSSNTGQSYVSKITSSVLGSFAGVFNGDRSSDDYYVIYTEESGFERNPSMSTGASNSLRAICNAANAAVSCVGQLIDMGTVVPGYTGASPAEADHEQV